MKAIPFSQMKSFSTGYFNNVPVLFNDFRILKDTLPEGVYAYDIRWDDDMGYFAMIEPNVWINHAGTIITIQPIEMGEEGYCEIEEYRFDDQDITVEQWMEENRPEPNASDN